MILLMIRVKLDEENIMLLSYYYVIFLKRVWFRADMKSVITQDKKFCGEL